MDVSFDGDLHDSLKCAPRTCDKEKSNGTRAYARGLSAHCTALVHAPMARRMWYATRWMHSTGRSLTSPCACRGCVGSLQAASSTRSASAATHAGSNGWRTPTAARYTHLIRRSGCVQHTHVERAHMAWRRSCYLRVRPCPGVSTSTFTALARASPPMSASMVRSTRPYSCRLLR